MACYENFDWFHPSYQSRPFGAMYSIAFRANQILKKRKPGEWSAAAEVLEKWVAEHKESRVEEETAQYIKARSETLASEGGWELAYLPRDPYDPYQSSSPPDAAEICNLLENWPVGADERPDFPQADDDLDTLADILCSGYPYDDIEGFPAAQEYELYAVYALIKINVAIWCLRIDDQIASKSMPLSIGSCPWKPSALINAGELVIEAMEFICMAERELRDAQFAKLRTDRESKLEAKLDAQIRKESELQRKALLSEAGKLGAQKKNSDFLRLKEWALEKASGMRGTDVDIARRLVSQLPLHMANVSKSPERLIYEAIRTARKN